MYQYKGFDDTIAAIATPMGLGGIAIVRLSGKGALSVLEKIFADGLRRPASGWPGFTARHGWIARAGGKAVDEVLVTVMRAPKSYTGEDAAEISCHGGFAAVRATLELCLENGARLAEPGEFTKRAFLNGRIDLAQAEAVLDVISAGTEMSLRAGVGQLKGELSCALEAVRQQLLHVLAGIEAFLNFPEDGTDVRPEESLPEEVAAALQGIDRLLSTAGSGRILREGLKVVICGKPNVGKSSLLNALLREPRAIVTDIAGTTRDTLEESANIDGIPLRLVDTAGILIPRDQVEEEAVRRARAMVESADMVLMVVDGSRELDASDRDILAAIPNRHVVVVCNKSDLPRAAEIDDLGALAAVPVSALTGEGMDSLKAALLRVALDGRPVDIQGAVVSNLRHIEALRQARGMLARAKESAEEAKSPEFVAEDIKSAVNALDAITGRNVDQDVVDEIFSRFCIGK